MDKALQNPYISVSYGEGLFSFGGNQRRAQRKITRSCGCGVIACTDLALYLNNHPMPIDAKEYNTLAESMRRKYLPLMPRLGTSGWMLALGMNLYFKRNGLKMRASWGVRKSRLRRCVAEMLSRELPVVLSIGQNFPLVWRKTRLNLYKSTDKGLVAVSSVKAHFVTVTGMDDEWFRVSSWGQEYFIRCSEYTDYVDKHSSWLISNILYIRKK